MHVLANTAAFAIPRHVVEAHGPQWATPDHIVTNGPFLLETWQPKERIVLRRSPDYRGRMSGNLSQVDLTLSDRRVFEQLLQAYEMDGVDALRLLPREVEQVRQQHGSELVKKPIAHTHFIFFTVPRPPFDDVRVRQALAHAIDRAKLVKTIYNELYTPGLGGFVPPGIPGYSDGIGLAYDPGLARRLLAEAGYPEGRGFPEIGAYIWESGNQLLPQFLQQQWQEALGIDIPCRQLAWEHWQEQRLEPATHLVANGWKADYPDPHNFLCEAPHLLVPGWRHTGYEHLLEAARHTGDPAERIKIYQAAERILIQEAVIIPLIYLQRHLLLKPWIKRYPVSSLGTSYWKDVVIEAH